MVRIFISDSYLVMCYLNALKLHNNILHYIFYRIPTIFSEIINFKVTIFDFEFCVTDCFIFIHYSLFINDQQHLFKLFNHFFGPLSVFMQFSLHFILASTLPNRKPCCSSMLMTNLTLSHREARLFKGYNNCPQSSSYVLSCILRQ